MLLLSQAMVKKSENLLNLPYSEFPCRISTHSSIEGHSECTFWSLWCVILSYQITIKCQNQIWIWRALETLVLAFFAILCFHWIIVNKEGVPQSPAGVFQDLQIIDIREWRMCYTTGMPEWKNTQQVGCTLCTHPKSLFGLECIFHYITLLSTLYRRQNKPVCACEKKKPTNCLTWKQRLIQVWLKKMLPHSSYVFKKDQCKYLFCLFLINFGAVTLWRNGGFSVSVRARQPGWISRSWHHPLNSLASLLLALYPIHCSSHSLTQGSRKFLTMWSLLPL